MKQSRKIRRSWLRRIPHWMKCFCRTVIKVAKTQSRKVARGFSCLHKNIQTQISRIGDGIRAHSKDWAAAALAAGVIISPYLAAAAPEGGVVVGGQATITQAGDVTNIAQSSQRAAIDWTSFNIAKQETVNFQQPNASSVALNRVLGNNASQIYGHLNANGIVYLSNPNGMYFAPGAQVNVAGLIATTSHVDPQAFMNEGRINTSERNAIISNEGNIFASGLVQIEGATAINNGGLIRATTLNSNGGKITIGNADNVTISGMLDVSATQNSGLTILSSGNGGTIEVIADKATGILDVSGATLLARGGETSGDGGFIETSGAEVYGLDEAIINAGAVNGASGTWYLDPLNITIDSGSGDISGTTIGAAILSTALSSQNVKISTAAFTGSEDGSIYINSDVSYDGTNNNSLWLLANKDISFAAGKVINYDGSGTLVLHADISGTGIGTVSGASLSLGNGTLAKIYYNPAAFGTADIAVTTAGSGSLVSHMLVNTSTQLQSIGNNPGWWNEDFALGKNIDMSGEAYTPIGDASVSYSGKFDGTKYNNSGTSSSYTISNLSINTTAIQYAGLFGNVGIGATVSNLTLVNPQISGSSGNTYAYFGGVAGFNSGIIDGVSISGGSISGDRISINGWVYVGGATGYNSNSLIGVTVNDVAISGGNGSGNTYYVGGQAGFNEGLITGATISGGTISGRGSNVNIGGLAGTNAGLIISSLVNGGNIFGGSSANDYVGGAAGYNSGAGSTLSGITISDTTISGSNLNIGTVYVGGQAGENEGLITGGLVSGGSIYADSTSGGIVVGGVAGLNNDINSTVGGVTVSDVTIGGSNVTTGAVYVGGQIGSNSGSLNGGLVSGGSISGSSTKAILYVGGAAGNNSSTISGITVRDVSVSASNLSVGAVYLAGLAGNNAGQLLNSLVSGGTISGSGFTQLYVGGAAGLNSGTISTVTVDGVTINAGTDVGTNNNNYIYVGGQAGENDGLITSSTVTGGNISCKSSGGTVRVGGAAGINTSTIDGITVSNMTLSGSSITNSYVYVGGVAGQNSGSGVTLGSSTISGAEISASGGSTVYVGGQLGNKASGTGVRDTRIIVTSGNASLSYNSGGAIVASLTGTQASVLQATESTLTLGASNITGGLTVNATGSVGETGAITADTATIKAGVNSIILNTYANNFGTLGLTGGDAEIKEADAVELAASNLSTLGLTAGGNLTVSGALTASGDVTLATVSGSTGDIIVNAGIIKTAGTDATLFVMADRNISLNGAAITSSSNKLNVTLDARAYGASSGYIGFGQSGNNSILTNGGNIIFGGGSDPAVGYAVGDSNSYASGICMYAYLPGGDNIIDAGGGNITMHGQGATASGVNVSSGVYFGGVAGFNTIKTTGTGTINVVGIGGSHTAAVINSEDCGINIYQHTSIYNTGNGAITLNGTAGSSPSGYGLNYGIWLREDYGGYDYIYSAGGGAITLTGKAGSGGQTANPTEGIAVACGTYEIGYSGTTVYASPITIVADTFDPLLFGGLLSFKTTSGIVVKQPDGNLTRSIEVTDSITDRTKLQILSDYFSSDNVFGTNFGFLTLGRTDATGSISVGGSGLNIGNKALNLYANGDITQTAAITAGTAALDAGVHGITLSSVNAFSGNLELSFNETSTINNGANNLSILNGYLGGASLSLTGGAVSVINDVSTHYYFPVTFGNIVADSLYVENEYGLVRQAAGTAITVTGGTTIISHNPQTALSINLDSASNNFGGMVSLTADTTAVVKQLSGISLTLGAGSVAALTASASDISVSDNVAATSGVTLNAFGSNGTAGQITFAGGKKITGTTAGTATINARPLSATATSLISGYSSLVGTYSLYDSIDLNNVRNDMYGTYTMYDDIAATGSFEPIGGQYNPFFGSFDGNGKQITNLTISVSGFYTQYAALFARAGIGSSVRNLTLVTPSITASGGFNGVAYAAGIAGENEGTITNVAISGGTVSSNYLSIKKNWTDYPGNAYVGGIAGQNSGVISNSSVNNVTIIGSGSGDGNKSAVVAGGVAAYNYGSGATISGVTVSGVSLSGVITSNSARGQGTVIIGGLVGQNNQTVQNSTLINNNVSVTAAYGSSYIGGTAGINSGAISGLNVNNATMVATAYDSSATEVAGGIAGMNCNLITGATVSMVSIAFTSTNGNVSVGMIAGNNQTDGSHTSIIKDAAVLGGSATGTAGKRADVGGIVGQNQGTITGNLSVGGTTLTASAGSAGGYAGGIVGSNLYNAITGGSVSGATISAQSSAAGAYAGGFAGQNAASITGGQVISASLSATAVSATVNIGNLVGTGTSFSGTSTAVHLHNGNASLNYNSGGAISARLTGASATLVQVSESSLTLGASRISNGGLLITVGNGLIQNGAITADSLTVSALNAQGAPGAFAVNLDNPENNIGIAAFNLPDGLGAQLLDAAAAVTLAASTLGNLNLTAAGSLLIKGSTVFNGLSSESVTSGSSYLVASNGALIIDADGKLTQNNPLAAPQNIYLAASGGNFVNSSNFGSNAISFLTQGRFIIWSGRSGYTALNGLLPYVADSYGTYTGYPPTNSYWSGSQSGIARNSGNWIMYNNTTDPVTISGQVWQYGGGYVADGTPIELIAGGKILGSANVTGGVFSIAGLVTGLGQSMLVYIDSSYIGGSAFATLSSGSGYNITAQTINVGVSGGASGVADMAGLRRIITSGGSIWSDPYLPYTYVVGSNNINITSGVTLNVNNAFTIDGNITTTAAGQTYSGAVTALSAATLAASGGSAIHLAGNLTATAAGMNIIATGGAVNIDGIVNAAGQTLTINTGRGMTAGTIAIAGATAAAVSLTSRSLVTNINGLISGTVYGDYSVDNYADLQNVGNDLSVNANYTLYTDITGGTTTFAPIGATAAFTGAFNGNNHSIVNLSIVDNTDGYAGLFGQIAYGATVSNLNISGLSVSTVNIGGYVGGIAGSNGGTISNITITGGNISASGSGYSDVYVGGVAGYDYGTITGVKVSDITICGSITDDSPGSLTNNIYVGGIVGQNDYAQISASVNRTTIVGIINDNSGGWNTDNVFAGGIAGFNNGTVTSSNVSGSNTTISGAVIDHSGGGNSNYVCAGGIAGMNSTDGNPGDIVLANVSAIGLTVGATVTANDINNFYTYAGGIAGVNCDTITGAYVSGGTINSNNSGGTAYAGGIIGQDQSGSYTDADTVASVNSGSISADYTSGGIIAVGMTGTAGSLTQNRESTLTLDTAVVSGGLTVNAAGSVITQTDASSLSLDILTINTAASVVLNNVTNSIGSLSFISIDGDMRLQDTAALKLTGTNTAYQINIYAGGGITLDGGTEITATTPLTDALILGTSGDFINNSSDSALIASVAGARSLVYVRNSANILGTALTGFTNVSPYKYGNPTPLDTDNHYCIKAGTVTIGGTASGMADGTTIVLVADGTSIGSATVAGNAYSITYTGDAAGDSFLIYAGTGSVCGGGAYAVLSTGSSFNLPANQLKVDWSGSVAGTGSMGALRELLTSAGSVYSDSYLPYSYVSGDKNITLHSDVALNVDSAFIVDGSIRTTAASQTYNGEVMAISAAALTAATSGVIRFADNLTANSAALTVNATDGVIFDQVVSAVDLTVNADANDISLNNVANSIVTLTVTGNTVSVFDIGALTLGAGSMVALNVTAGGNVTQSGILTVSGTATISAGPGVITLDDTNNDFDSISFTSTGSGTNGNVTIKDKDDLTIIGSNSGQAVIVSALGSLTLATGSTVTAGATDDALTLVTGGNFTNSGTSTALTAANGRWLVYSTDPRNDTGNGLSNNFKQYNATYGTTTVAQATGNGFLYKLAPEISYTIGGTATKEYDGNIIAPVSGITYSGITGLIDGDSGTVTITGANYDNSNAGTGKTVSITTANISATNGAVAVYGYSQAPGVTGAIGEISKAPLMITANNAGKIYGDAYTFTTTAFTASGLKNSETVGGVTLASAGAATGANVTAGGYAITPSNASGGTFNANNYAITYSTAGILTVNPATLTNVAANNLNRKYGDTNPDLTGTASGWKLTDGDSLLSGFSTTATTASNVDVYVIDASGVNAGGNYTISGTKANGTLTVNKADLTVAANNLSREYGDANPTLTGTITGFKNGQDISVLTAEPMYGTTATTLSNVGTATITVGGATAQNYSFSYTPGTLTITAAPLTITANAASKTYGDAYTFATTAFTASGLKNSETVGSVTLASAGADTGANVTAGGYVITPSNANGGTFDANNYAITYSTAGTLTVSAAPLTVTANSYSRAYGDANPTLTGTITGFKNGQDISVLTAAPVYGTTATTLSNVGTATITVGGATAQNYSFSYTPGTLTITAAPLTITANDASKTYGDVYAFSNTAFTASGLKNSETVGGVTLVSAGADTGANVTAGGYVITPSNASGGTFDANNYAISYSTAGTLTVNKAALTVTANDFSREYGDANPALGGTISGFKNGQDISVLTAEPVYGTTATTLSNVGTATITVGGAAAQNYSFSYTPGALNITAAPLTVTANSYSRAYGTANPVLGGTITGFKNGQDSSVLTTQPVYTTTATPTTPAGLVPITVSGAVAQNYRFIYVDGVLTIISVGPTPEEQAAEAARQAAINAANNANRNANNTTNQKQITNEKPIPAGNNVNGGGTADTSSVSATGNQPAGGLEATLVFSPTGVEVATPVDSVTSAATMGEKQLVGSSGVTGVVALPDPANSVDYFVRGNAYANNGKSTAAVADYSKAIEESPEFAQAYFNRGLEKEKLNQLNEALADFRKAISIEPRLAEKLPVSVREIL